MTSDTFIRNQFNYYEKVDETEHLIKVMPLRSRGPKGTQHRTELALKWSKRDRMMASNGLSTAPESFH